MTSIPERKVRNVMAVVLIITAAVVIVWQGRELTQEREAVRVAKEAAKVEREAARIERLRAELILASSPFGFVMCDDSQKIVFANAAAEDLLGWGTGALHGQPVEVMIPEDARADHFRASTLAAKEMMAAQKNYVVRRYMPNTKARKKNGDEVAVDIGLQAIKFGRPGEESVEFIAAIKPTDMRQVPRVVPLPPIEENIERRREQIERSIKEKAE